MHRKFNREMLHGSDLTRDRIGRAIEQGRKRWGTVDDTFLSAKKRRRGMPWRRNIKMLPKKNVVAFAQHELRPTFSWWPMEATVYVRFSR
ncbi:hypothetical protein Pla100_43610 [Neorhodopirellula pilleata]|uniref:Uncharacterized protein n=1 Tax=Neorhodopirellula pilleata TaxID=2714738 RepID=A0A5C6A0X5_9BACT|nr:hypothetical protein Pla100_43610 [Neorhodopirellula pilleata]